MKKRDVIIGLVVAIFLAGVISMFASSHPDGLEKVAENLGFLEKGEGQPLVKSPVPDYEWPGLENKKLATSIAGIAGTLIVFGLSYGLAVILRRKEHKAKQMN
ncbi:MAG: cobalt/nickel transport protein [Candidatus Poribacteria bacterium]|nr:cobalt/nickel transport protein [Candidatus Poribacteria bacterium]